MRLKTAALCTLGCKVNQVETEQMKEDFISRGYKLVDFNQPADVYVINTCTVTHVSDRKSRAMIRRAARRNKTAIVAVTGCLAQCNPEFLSTLDGVDLIIGNAQKRHIVDIIDRLPGKPDRPIIMAEAITRENRPPKRLYTVHHQRTRGFVKIEDGCENFCTYCIVPLVRGPVRSKFPDDVRAEVEDMISLGYREVVFTGINTGLYGQDLSGWDLERLLKFLLEQIKGDYRFRLSSIEPLEMGSGLIELAAADRRICRHFHIPLQSGSDPVLQQMGRKYTVAHYCDLISTITSQIPGVALTTDVMVGFPGETEANFADTYQLLEELPFYNLHVFKYSRRAGTKAALRPEQVSEEVKQLRSSQLLELATRKRYSFLESQVGKVLNTLVEAEAGNSRFNGITDNYINIDFPAGSSGDCRPGRILPVKLTDYDDLMAHGELVANEN